MADGGGWMAEEYVVELVSMVVMLMVMVMSRDTAGTTATATSCTRRSGR